MEATVGTLEFYRFIVQSLSPPAASWLSPSPSPMATAAFSDVIPRNGRRGRT